MEGYLIRLIAWTKLKIRLHLKPDKQIVYFNEREVWWTSIGMNIGHEEYGKNEYFERPVLILKKINRNIFWGLPMASKNKTGEYYYQINYENEYYSIILSQLKVMSSKRLSRKIRRLPKSEFIEVEHKIKSLL